MILKKFIFLLAITISLSSFSQFAGGSGTSEDPYQVATAEHLNNIRYNLTSHYIQTADIDLGIAPWNEGEGWEPIGDYYWTNPAISFSGDYDGNDYEIRNLTINRPDRSYCGLFGASLNSTFQNIHLLYVNIIGSSSVGGLVGLQNSDNLSELITNCSVAGYVEAKATVGMLIGHAVYAIINDCNSSGELISIKNDTNNAGGLVGEYWCGSLHNSYSDISITSQGNGIGGLIGQADFLNSIKNCYSIMSIKNSQNFIGGLFGTLTSDSSRRTVIDGCFVRGEISSLGEQIGGFVGFSSGYGYDNFNYPVTFNNCYTNVDINGNDIVGGFVGKTYDYIFYKNCYSRGYVTGSSNVGGFIGYQDSPSTTVIENCYWDTEVSGLLTSDGGEGRTTAEMTLPYTGNTYNGWDFGTVWADDVFNLNDGYPMLQWACGIEDDEDNVIPETAVLYQNYPNPFNPTTTIRYSLSSYSDLRLSIYGISGKEVAVLFSGKQAKGNHSVIFNAENLTSGLYFYRLTVDGKAVQTRKLMLLK